MPTALITGASKGLGRAVTHVLAERGWSLIVDARGADELVAATASLDNVIAIPGDITDPAHRAELAGAVGAQSRLDLLVNNASALGASPLPPLADYPSFASSAKRTSSRRWPSSSCSPSLSPGLAAR
jgi:NAD(P)-dependent dehydrogenase (short-subunit alcohol dehydrogenase family)